MCFESPVVDPIFLLVRMGWKKREANGVGQPESVPVMKSMPVHRQRDCWGWGCELLWAVRFTGLTLRQSRFPISCPCGFLPTARFTTFLGERIWHSFFKGQLVYILYLSVGRSYTLSLDKYKWNEAANPFQELTCLLSQSPLSI